MNFDALMTKFKIYEAIPGLEKLATKYYPFFQKHPILEASLIVVGYIIIAKVINFFIEKVLKRLAKATKHHFDDQVIHLIHGPLFWTIVFMGGLHAVVVIYQIPQFWQDILINGLKSLILLIWWITTFRFVNLITSKILPKLPQTEKIGRDLFQLIKNLLYVVVTVVGFLWLLSIWHVNLTPIFASAGVAGIAVALAAKDTLANFFGGLSIFMDRPFKMRDYIILDSGERGEVVDIGIRSTRIKTRDDVLITIPNSVLANAKIINESAPAPRFRIRVPVGVSYDADLKLVEKTLVAVAKKHVRIAATPEPRARIRAFGESSIDFELLCWVTDPRDKGIAMHELFHAIFLAFKENGIEIPFPQRDIHIIPSADAYEDYLEKPASAKKV